MMAAALSIITRPSRPSQWINPAANIARPMARRSSTHVITQCCSLAGLRSALGADGCQVNRRERYGYGHTECAAPNINRLLPNGGAVGGQLSADASGGE